MAVSRRVRFEVLRRDNHQCRYCGASAPDAPLTVDHVVPVTLGGSDDPSNLVTACKDCNSGKASTSPDSAIVADIDAKAAQWAQAMAIVAERRATERNRREQITQQFFEHWEAHRESHWRSADMAPGWETSLMTFLDAGLEVDDIKDLMVIALKTRAATDKWRYFCGCCWTRIRQAQEQAAEIVSQWERDDDATTVAEQVHWSTGRDWEKATGTRLAPCMCVGPSCGDDVCVIAVAMAAEGALQGIEWVRENFTTREPDKAQIEEAPSGA